MADKKTGLQKKQAENVDRAEPTRSGRVFLPATDIIETNDEIVLLADMPGVKKDGIHVTLENNTLTIRGDVESAFPKDHNLIYSEYDVGDYFRSFTLSDTIDREKIEAKYSNGVLRLRLPKAEAARAREIAVTTE